MSEGYYEEPLKFSTRSLPSFPIAHDVEAVYENDRKEQCDANKLKKQFKILKSCSQDDLFSITRIFIYIIVASTMIFTIVSLIISVENAKTTRKEFLNLREILLSIQENVTLPRNESSLWKETEIEKNETCETTYNHKCFKLVKTSTNLSLSEAREKCRKMDGMLANVYDLTHFNQLSSLLIKSIKPGFQMNNAWTGMTVDSKTKKLLLNNFTFASDDIPWYPGRYYTKKKMPYLGINVRSTTNLCARGMYDAKSTQRFNSAICEFKTTQPCGDV